MTADVPLLLGFIDIGPVEMLLVGIVALLLFGKNLPEVARSVGRGISEFKQGLMGLGEEGPSSSLTARRATYQDDVDDYIAPSAPKFEPPASELEVPDSTPVPHSDTAARN
jgi:sec-independent protein translocase protein TatA